MYSLPGPYTPRIYKIWRDELWLRFTYRIPNESANKNQRSYFPFRGQYIDDEGVRYAGDIDVHI